MVNACAPDLKTFHRWQFGVIAYFVIGIIVVSAPEELVVGSTDSAPDCAMV